MIAIRTPVPTVRPEPHFKLTPIGTAALFGAGSFLTLTCLGIGAVNVVITAAGAIGAGGLLAIARAEARKVFADCYFERARDGYLWRPTPAPLPLPEVPVDLDMLAADRRCGRIAERRAAAQRQRLARLLPPEGE